MIKSMPNSYSRDMVQQLLDEKGFSKLYDFLYLPIDFKSHSCLGYCFINFTSEEAAQRCWGCFEGFNDWCVPSRKVAGVGWSSECQGLEAHIRRYRNSAVMSEGVPESCRPVVFKDGVRAPFPAPTRRIRTPWLRQPPRRVADSAVAASACALN
jgi:RNA recognition motif-containing protein